MTTKHTPGPWKVTQNSKLRWAGVLTQKGDIIASISVDNADFRGSEQASNDAHLIAAAPDMLRVCQMLVEWWNAKGIEGTADTDEIVAAARRILLSLEGKS